MQMRPIARGEMLASRARLAPALISAHHVMPCAAPLPICRPQTHYCRLVYPAGPWLWAGASGNDGLSNHQTVIYKGGPAT